MRFPLFAGKTVTEPYGADGSDGAETPWLQRVPGNIRDWRRRTRLCDWVVLPAAVAAVLAVSAWTLTERGLKATVDPGSPPLVAPRSLSVNVRLLKEREPPAATGSARVPSVAARALGSRSLNSYPVDWRHRYLLERAHVHRLLRRLARARTTQAHESPPPHYQQWLCIYRYENAGYGWAANTGNGYYGGLQQDLDFQRTYAPGLLRAKGTADHWTPLEQMWAAERAWQTRGFSPWPNTARMCGLL